MRVEVQMLVKGELVDLRFDAKGVAVVDRDDGTVVGIGEATLVEVQADEAMLMSLAQIVAAGP